MASNSQMADVLAFLQRALGLHPRSRPFEDLPGRSRRALVGLSAPPTSLRFRVALRQLRYDWDLLNEDAANDDDALRLQLRVLELAGNLPDAAILIHPNLNEAPIGRLFAAILAQAVDEETEAIEFRFEAAQAESIRVTKRTRRGETRRMEIPWSLENGLRGLLRLVEAAGFARVRPYLRREGLPGDLTFVWTDSESLTLKLNAKTLGSSVTPAPSA